MIPEGFSGRKYYRLLLEVGNKIAEMWQCPKARVRIGDEIIVDIWEADKRRWAGIFPDMIELTPCGEFQVCPKTGEWLREVAPQFLPNRDNLPEDIVLSRIQEFAR